MTAFIEPLPGLLDDPLLHLSDLPPRADVRIPPLRDPFPSRALSILSPLEPNAPEDKQIQGGLVFGSSKNASKPRRTTPKITPADVISARDTKKPDLAISALVESGSTNSLSRLLPPSFVNLAAVENKPSFQSWLPEYPPSKRVKIDQDYHGDYVQLPRPRQKEASKFVPLLPTIVNGIHEPPPSAALLPPMELEEVKAMLASISDPPSLPPEKMLNPAQPDPPDPPDPPDLTNRDGIKLAPFVLEVGEAIAASIPVNPKPPRTWRKWSEEETQDLLKGVARHGAGKWKEIRADPDLKFRDRKPTDLKDRFRICFPSTNKERSEGVSHANPDNTSSAPRHTTNHPLAQEGATSTTTKPPPPSSDIPPIAPTPTTKSRPSPSSSPSHPRSRIRKLWTESEHQNLVKGFAKHGYQWTAIRNDAALSLSHRKATDIRDKFRSLFPQQYMDAESGPRVVVGGKGSVCVGGRGGGGGVGGKAGGSEAGAGMIHGSEVEGDSGIGNGAQVLGSLGVEKRKSGPPSSLLRQSLPPPRPEDTSRDAAPAVSVLPIESSLESNAPHEASSSAVPNLTLPPLTLEDNDWDWGDNKLAPLLDWEEFGL